MNLANRIRSEMNQAMSWKQYRDLLIDVLYSSGRYAANDTIRSVFNQDYFADTKRLARLLIDTGLFDATFANTFLSSGTQLSPLATLKALLDNIDANNYLGQFAGAALGIVGSGGAMPTGWFVENPLTMVVTVTDIAPYQGKPSIAWTFTGTNASGGALYPSAGVLLAATPGQLASMRALTSCSGTGSDAGPNLQVQSRNAGNYVANGSGDLVGASLAEHAASHTIAAASTQAYFLWTAEILNSKTAALTWRLMDYTVSVN